MMCLSFNLRKRLLRWWLKENWKLIRDDYSITRNIKEYKKATIKVVTPEVFLTKHK
jgi:hypothetical protein